MTQKYEVSVNLAQDFTDPQKAQALANLGLSDVARKSDLSGSCLITPRSEWQTMDGTDVTLMYIWTNGTPSTVTGNKVRLATADGQTKYRVEAAALGAYRMDAILHAKWEGTPVNKTGSIYGFRVDLSKNFELILGRQSTIFEMQHSQRDFYGIGFPVPASYIDAPNGIKIAIQLVVEYIGPVPEAT